jgi:hypothetical protein
MNPGIKGMATAASAAVSLVACGVHWLRLLGGKCDRSVIVTYK